MQEAKHETQHSHDLAFIPMTPKQATYFCAGMPANSMLSVNTLNCAPVPSRYWILWQKKMRQRGAFEGECASTRQSPPVQSILPARSFEF